LPTDKMGVLEPDAVKVARPVLRTAQRREALGLSDRQGSLGATAPSTLRRRRAAAPCERLRRNAITRASARHEVKAIVQRAFSTGIIDGF
jgi:hypothetical protein